MHGAENMSAFEKKLFTQENLAVVANCRGFTLVELIMVIVLISIVAVSIVPKFVDTSAISLEGGAAMVAGDIRYTQELAMSTHSPKTITFATNDTFYTIDSQTTNLPSRVSISIGATFTFNPLGEPTAGGGSSVVIQAGSSTKTITVESITGRVSSS